MGKAIVTTIPQPEGIPRVETGIVKFGDDWQDVFIRGDNSFHYAMCLRAMLKQGEMDVGGINATVFDPISKVAVEGLARLLESSCELYSTEMRRYGIIAILVIFTILAINVGDTVGDTVGDPNGFAKQDGTSVYYVIHI